MTWNGYEQNLTVRPHEYEELRHGSHVAALKAAAKTDMPIMPGARACVRRWQDRLRATGIYPYRADCSAWGLAGRTTF